VIQGCFFFNEVFLLPKYLYPEKSVRRKQRTQIVAELRRKGQFPNLPHVKLNFPGLGKAPFLTRPMRANSRRAGRHADRAALRAAE